MEQLSPFCTMETLARLLAVSRKRLGFRPARSNRGSMTSRWVEER